MSLKEAPDPKDRWVVFDFDGVCASYKEGWQGPDIFGEPIKEVAELTKELHKKGFKTCLFTTRPANKVLMEYLTDNGFEFDSVNSAEHNPPDANKIKPIGELYIDDRAMRFNEGDPDAIELIKGMLHIQESKGGFTPRTKVTKIREAKFNLNEMKDTPIITITRIVDDDTGIWANDEFEFALHEDYRTTYKMNSEKRKRLADELRSVATMIEKDEPTEEEMKMFEEEQQKREEYNKKAASSFIKDVFGVKNESNR